MKIRKVHFSTWAVFLTVAVCTWLQAAPGFSIGLQADAAAAKIYLKLTVPEDGYIDADSLQVIWPDTMTEPEADSAQSTLKAESAEDGETRIYNKSGMLVYDCHGTLPDLPIDVTVTYSACSGGLCYLPETLVLSCTDVSSSKVNVNAPSDIRSVPAGDAPYAWLAPLTRIEGYKNAAEFSDILNHVYYRGGQSAPENWAESTIREFTASHGWLLLVLVILILGFLLNLTPCVLPMIPINLAILGAKIHASNFSPKRGFLLGMLYGAGQAIAFGSLGAVFVVFGGMFADFTHTALFNFVIAAIFVILALGMLDVIVIDFSRFRRSTGAPGTGNAYATAVFLGILAALLASSCIAPSLIWILLLSTQLYSEGHHFVLLLPFILGIGLALPWPFLASGITHFPKAGRWMMIVKYVFAALIFITAIYYAICGWKILRQTISTVQIETEEWTSALDNAIKTAKETNRLILLDFWGYSCKNCDAMEATTLKSDAVLQALENYEVVKINADNPSPDLKQFLEALNVIGLPTYIIASPQKMSPP